jgi:uncharacterized protein YegP (UPF0339 family)
MAEFSVFKNERGKLIWRFYQSGNFQLIAESWKEYNSLSECLYDINIMKSQGPTAAVDDETKPLLELKKENKEKNEKKKRKKMLFF